jgi:hypothetical protein
MLRTTTILLAFALWAATLPAQDLYHIRASIVGYEDRLDFEIEPEEDELRVFETVAQLGVPFFTKVETGRIDSPEGREILILSGKLNEVKDGLVNLEIRLAELVDTGCRVPIGGGEVQKVLDESIVKCQIAIPFDEPVEFGSLESSSSSRRHVWLTRSGQESAVPVPDGTQAEVLESRISKRRHVLHVSKYQPKQD